MEKISSIIPASPRVQTVDMKDSSPVRPGTPGFGRPEGKSPNDWRLKEAMHAKMADQVSRKFFMKPDPEQQAAPAVAAALGGAVPLDATTREPIASITANTQSKPAGFKTEELDRFNLKRGDKTVEPTSEEDSGPYPKGSFIDYSA